MKKGGFVFLLFFLIAGLSSSLFADECYEVINIPVKKVTKVYETYTKKVPYKTWKTVCVPIKDSCNRVVGYKSKKVCVTKYKNVTKKIFKGYKHVGYYNGTRVDYFWRTRLCTIPIKVPTSCCTTTVTTSCDTCNSCNSCSVN